MIEIFLLEFLVLYDSRSDSQITEYAEEKSDNRYHGHDTEFIRGY